MPNRTATLRGILADARKGADASVIARRTGLRPEQVLTICRRRRVPVTWRNPERRHDPPSCIPDHFKLANAELLAERIRQYWADEGCAVDVRIETTGNGHHSLGHIRSNMVNGWPRTHSLAGDSRARVHQHPSSPSLQSNDRNEGDADPCAKGTASCRTG